MVDFRELPFAWTPVDFRGLPSTSVDLRALPSTSVDFLGLETLSTTGAVLLRLLLRLLASSEYAN